MMGMAYRPLADMESNGVYFDEEYEKTILENNLCQYSGLPSISSYLENKEEKDEIILGHS